MVESAPVAEYREWSLQGLLKRTKIGNETTYNLESQVSLILDYLYLPALLDALGIHSRKEPSAEDTTSHKTGKHSRVHSAASQSKRMRVL
jgi:hypothetical protein